MGLDHPGETSVLLYSVMELLEDSFHAQDKSRQEQQLDAEANLVKQRAVSASFDVHGTAALTNL